MEISCQRQPGAQGALPDSQAGGEGRCDHLVSMAATRTGSFALFTCDSMLKYLQYLAVGRPQGQSRQTFFSPALEGCNLYYAIVPSSLPTHALRAMPTWACGGGAVCRDAGLKRGVGARR